MASTAMGFPWSALDAQNTLTVPGAEQTHSFSTGLSGCSFVMYFPGVFFLCPRSIASFSSHLFPSSFTPYQPDQIVVRLCLASCVRCALRQGPLTPPPPLPIHLSPTFLCLCTPLPLLSVYFLRTQPLQGYCMCLQLFGHR